MEYYTLYKLIFKIFILIVKYKKKDNSSHRNESTSIFSEKRPHWKLVYYFIPFMDILIIKFNVY